MYTLSAKKTDDSGIQSIDKRPIIEKIVQSFQVWAIENKLRLKKRDFDKDQELIRKGTDFLYNFFEYSYDLGWLENYFSIDSKNEVIINWEIFPFMDFYNICCEYLKGIELTRTDYSTDPNSEEYLRFCTHHIKPKFSGGGDEANNLVLLHYFEHGYLHLIRWLVTDMPSDLGGFTSAMNAKSKRKLQIERRRESQPKLSLPPLPPPAAERKKPAKTAKTVRAGQTVGQKYQLQSLAKANPFSLFLANSILKFLNLNGTEVIHKPSGDIKNVSDNSASAIGRKLNAVCFTETLGKNPSIITKLLSGENKILQNGKLVGLFIGDLEYQITKEIVISYQTLYDTLTEYFNQNQELSISELTQNMAVKRNSNFEETVLIQEMFTFIKKWSFLMKGIADKKADDDIEIPND